MTADRARSAESLPSCLAALPLHRAAVERFVERLAPLPEVDAAFISGSTGRNEAGPHSDLDLVLVAGEAANRASLHDRAPDLVRELGNALVVTQAVHVTPTLWLGVLDGPLCVDLDIPGWEKERPGPWLRSFTIVKDLDGRLAAARAASQGPYAGYDAGWLGGLSERWWRWMFYCAKDHRRGAHMTALANFEFLHQNAIRPLRDALAGRPTEGSADLGNAWSQRAASIIGNAGADERSWQRALLALHGLFLELRDEVQAAVPHQVPPNEPQMDAALRAYIGEL